MRDLFTHGMKWMLVVATFFILTGCLGEGETSTGAHIEGDNNIICLGNTSSDEDDATGAAFNCGNPVDNSTEMAPVE